MTAKSTKEKVEGVEQRTGCCQSPMSSVVGSGHRHEDTLHLPEDTPLPGVAYWGPRQPHVFVVDEVSSTAQPRHRPHQVLLKGCHVLFCV